MSEGFFGFDSENTILIDDIINAKEKIMSLKKAVKDINHATEVWYKVHWLKKYEDKKINDKKDIWTNYELSSDEIKAIEKID